MAKKANENITTTEKENPDDQTFYGNWHISMPEKENRTVDIFSDGILRQKDFSLLFEKDESGAERNDIPVMSTDIINIFSSVVLDTGFFKRAAESGITVNFFGQTGKLLGQFTPFSSLRSPRTTLTQLEYYYDSHKRVPLASQFVLASIHNLRLVIRYYNKMYPNALYDVKLGKLEIAERKIKDCKVYHELLLLEAQAKQFYYDCFDGFIRAKGFAFEKRSRRPPLDVRVGFLHATNRREQSLNLDIAEIFKPLLVDRVVFSLINNRAVTPDDFCTDGKGIYLNAEGKQLFLKAFYDKLDTGVTVNGKRMKYKSIIREEVQKLVRYFRQGEKYKPFKQIR